MNGLDVEMQATDIAQACLLFEGSNQLRNFDLLVLLLVNNGFQHMNDLPKRGFLLSIGWVHIFDTTMVEITSEHAAAHDLEDSMGVVQTNNFKDITRIATADSAIKFVVGNVQLVDLHTQEQLCALHGKKDTGGSIPTLHGGIVTNPVDFKTTFVQLPLLGFEEGTESREIVVQGLVFRATKEQCGITNCFRKRIKDSQFQAKSLKAASFAIGNSAMAEVVPDWELTAFIITATTNIVVKFNLTITGIFSGNAVLHHVLHGTVSGEEQIPKFRQLELTEEQTLHHWAG